MQCVPLTFYEAEIIRDDPEAVQRVIKSFELILDFWGMWLKDPATGEIERSDNYEKQFRNLQYSGHNYLRITRVLKCLGELGLERLCEPWLNFMITEVFVHKNLSNCSDSCCNYWVPVLRDDAARERLNQRIKELIPSQQHGSGEDGEW